MNYLRYVKEATEHYGRFPTVKEYNAFARERGYLLYPSVRKHIGKGWAQLYIEYGQPRNSRDPELIKEHLKRAAEKYGHAITKRQYIEYAQNTEGAPSIRDVCVAFETFNKAKETAGLYPNRGFGTEVVTPEACLQALKAFSETTGKTKFTEDDYEEWRTGTSYPSKETIRLRFKSFSAALLEAGYEPVVMFSEDTMWRDIFDFLEEHLCLEAYERWAKRKDRFTFQEYRKRGHSFRETMKKACDIYFSRKQN